MSPNKEKKLTQFPHKSEKIIGFSRLTCLLETTVTLITQDLSAVSCAQN